MTETNTQALIDFIAEHSKPVVISVTDPATSNKVPVLVLPDGSTADLSATVAPWRTAPVRRKGTAKLVDLASFIAHVNRFKDAGSALFADPAAPSLTGMLDYHEAAKPRFGEHRALYPFPVSTEWKAWTGKNAAQMSQADFAAFLEDRIQDVIDVPADDEKLAAVARRIGAKYGSPDRLMELSRGLAIKADVQVVGGVVLQSGEAQVEFAESHSDKAGNKLSVPGLFVVAIPVFDAGPLYRLPVRLRYRLSGGRVIWFYEMFHADRAKDDAFREQCEAAAKDTGLPLFYGSPE